jgi:ATP adenylyltransferase
MLLTNDGHRRQHEALDSDDLSAAWSLLSAATIEDYVVFFNGGRDAGCSRMHKHLQLIPLPSSTFASSLDFVEGELPEPEVTFKWFYYRLSATPQTTPESLTEVYTTLLQKATDSFPQKPNGPSGGVCPHNFLLTKRWMLVIPRREWGISREAGVNAVGMIGVMPCSTRAEMESWIKKGVGEALAEVAVPR